MNIELGEVQAAFADIIWTNEPVGSGELVKICEREVRSLLKKLLMVHYLLLLQHLFRKKN